MIVSILLWIWCAAVGMALVAGLSVMPEKIDFRYLIQFALMLVGSAALMIYVCTAVWEYINHDK